YQKNATWHLNNTAADTIYNNMLLWSIAAFADLPLQDNKFALNAYIGYFNTDYGFNYIRNNGIMAMANGNNNPANFSGGGNAYPMFGTGQSIYAQVGLRLPEDLLGDNGTFMPYIAYRRSDYTRLKDPVNIYDAGINWLINKHQSKVSINYQIRPVYEIQPNGDVTNTSNANSVWLQYQISL
ncbi:MAG: hypothetical protein ACXWDO_11870, partial [Bacteroidia bacterium]